jgi:hypothetical protein
MDTSKEISGDFGSVALRDVVSAAKMGVLLADLPNVLRQGPQASMDWFATYIGLVANDGVREKGMQFTAQAFREAGYPPADMSEYDGEAKQTKSSFARFIIGTALQPLDENRMPDIRATNMLINEYYDMSGNRRPWIHISTSYSNRYA